MTPRWTAERSGRRARRRRSSRPCRGRSRGRPGRRKGSLRAISGSCRSRGSPPERFAIWPRTTSRGSTSGARGGRPANRRRRRHRLPTSRGRPGSGGATSGSGRGSRSGTPRRSETVSPGARLGGGRFGAAGAREGGLRLYRASQPVGRHGARPLRAGTGGPCGAGPLRRAAAQRARRLPSRRHVRPGGVGGGPRRAEVEAARDLRARMRPRGPVVERRDTPRRGARTQPRGDRGGARRGGVRSGGRAALRRRPGGAHRGAARGGGDGGGVRSCAPGPGDPG